MYVLYAIVMQWYVAKVKYLSAMSGQIFQIRVWRLGHEEQI